ncbi:MAG: S-layer homology domain-containing protein [Firmicutes bacterium]|nr:S-layer homology domain-containing protein [Bacillota bacterium]
MRRFLAAMMVGIMAFSSAVFADEAEKTVFPDVTGDTQRAAVMKMYENGYIAGYEDGSFKPDNEITRAELVRVINQVFGYERKDGSEEKPFADINEKDWFYNDVMIAKDNSYIFGFPDDTFRPKENFTRQQVCVVLNSILGYQSRPKEVVVTDTISPWAENYVLSVVSNGVFDLEEGGRFRATENITRGEVCIALAKYIYSEEETEKDENVTVTEINNKKIVVNKDSKVSTSSSGGGGGSSSSSKSTTQATTSSSSETSTETTTTDSNSSSSSKNTTSATTEKATESTTANDKMTESTTSSSSSGSSSETKSESTTSSSKTVTEKTTESTTKASSGSVERSTEGTTEVVSVDAKTKQSARSVYYGLYELLEKESGISSEMKNIVKTVADGMDKFCDTGVIDSGEIASAKSAYKSLSSEEKEQLKNLIMKYNYSEDLLRLRSTFENLLY